MSAAATRSAAAILLPARRETGGTVPPAPVMKEPGSACPKAANAPEIRLSNLYMHVCILALTSIAADVEYRSTSVDVAGKTPRHKCRKKQKPHSHQTGSLVQKKRSESSR